MRAVMLSVLAGVLMAPVPFEPGPAPPRIALVDRLVDDLATRLEDPAAFSSLVAAQSNGFPEGPLFSRVLPAYGLISIARDDPARAPEMVAHLDVLLAQVLVETRRKVGTDVTSLSSYAEHGTWLGHVGVALGGYHLVGGTQFVAERERIASVLTTAIAAQNGAPIASYPSLTWSYDTTPALLAIHLDDVATGQDRAGPLLDAHLTWLIASGDPDLGLPYSRQIPNTEPPRGCDRARCTIAPGSDADCVVAAAAPDKSPGAALLLALDAASRSSLSRPSVKPARDGCGDDKSWATEQV